MGKQLVQTSRRKFIGRVGAAGAATVAAGVVGFEPLFGTARSEARAASVAQGSNQRANNCAKLRRDSAQAGLQATPQNLQHPANGDEDLYPNKIASYSKGLPHDANGTVVLSAYAAMLKALNSGSNDDFNAIQLGGDRRLTNPQSGLAFDMEGADSMRCCCRLRRRFRAANRQPKSLRTTGWLCCATFLMLSIHQVRSPMPRPLI